jgi:hypothetical protein
VLWLEGDRHAPEEITIFYYHSGACGDARGRFECAGGCFAVNESTAEEGAA